MGFNEYAQMLTSENLSSEAKRRIHFSLIRLIGLFRHINPRGTSVKLFRTATNILAYADMVIHSEVLP